MLAGGELTVQTGHSQHAWNDSISSFSHTGQQLIPWTQLTISKPLMPAVPRWIKQKQNVTKKEKREKKTAFLRGFLTTKGLSLCVIWENKWGCCRHLVIGTDCSLSRFVVTILILPPQAHFGPRHLPPHFPPVYAPLFAGFLLPTSIIPSSKPCPPHPRCGNRPPHQQDLCLIRPKSHGDGETCLSKA